MTLPVVKEQVSINSFANMCKPGKIICQAEKIVQQVSPSTSIRAGKREPPKLVLESNSLLRSVDHALPSKRVTIDSENTGDLDHYLEPILILPVVLNATRVKWHNYTNGFPFNAEFDTSSCLDIGAANDLGAALPGLK